MNRKCICQVMYATIRGDMVVAQASSAELEKYGIPAGHKNYAAAYCTGLLVARRVLKRFGLDESFKGKEELDGDDYHVEDEEGDQRPFKCILDVGLQIPHSNKRFPGYKAPEEKGQDAEYDAEAHKDKIFGVHVKEYMEMLAEEDPTKYEAHFSKYIEADIDADKIEEMYTEAHSKIREEPDHEPAEKKGITHTREDEQMTSSDGTMHVRSAKLTLEQRRAKVAEKIAAAQAKLMKEDE